MDNDPMRSGPHSYDLLTFTGLLSKYSYSGGQGFKIQTLAHKTWIPLCFNYVKADLHLPADQGHLPL